MTAEEQATEIAKRQEKVESLYLQGHSQLAIAHALGVSVATVNHDLADLRAKWALSANAAVADYKAEQLAKIDWVEFQAAKAWDRSQKDKEVHTAEQSNDAGEGGAKSKTAIRREGQVGDGEYLRIIRECIKDRLTIRGLMPPTKVAPTDPTGEKEYAGSERGNSPLATLLADLRQTVDGPRDGSAPPGEGETGSQPAPVDAPDGPADPGLPERGG